jgi:hypothetical protein
MIACVGDIYKLQLNIWSSYGLLDEIKKIFPLSSPLFFEVYGLAHDDIGDTKRAHISPENPKRSEPQGRCTLEEKKAAPPLFVGCQVVKQRRSSLKATRNDVRGSPYGDWVARE